MAWRIACLNLFLNFLFSSALHLQSIYLFKTGTNHFISLALTVLLYLQHATATHFSTSRLIYYDSSNLSIIFSYLLFPPLWISRNTIKPKVIGLICIHFAVFLAQCAIFYVSSSSSPSLPMYNAQPAWEAIVYLPSNKHSLADCCCFLRRCPKIAPINDG
jgi:hypothetical protein